MNRKKVDGREIVKISEFIQLINDKGFLMKDNFYKSNGDALKFFLDNKIEFLSKDDERNPYNRVHLFYADSVSIVEQILFDKIEICNVENSEFKITKDDFIDCKTFEDKFYTCDETAIMLANGSPIFFGTGADGIKRARRHTRRYSQQFNYIKLNNNIYFIKKEINYKVERLSNATTQEEARKILNNQKVEGREIVKLKEMVQLILDKSTFLRQHFVKTKFMEFFKENNIEFLDINDEQNPYKNYAYAFYADTILAVEQAIINSIQIHNIEGSKFNISRDSLTPENIMNEFYTTKEAGVILGNSLPDLFKTDNENELFEENAHKFMRRNCKNFNYFNYIELGIGTYSCIYVGKEEVNQMAENLSGLISSRDAMKIVNERLNLNIKYRTFSTIIANEGFVSKVENPFKSDWFWINKSDIDDITSYFHTRNRFNEAETAYGKLQVYLSSMEKIKNDKIPETLKYFDSHCLEKSNKSKKRQLIDYATTFKYTYMVITSKLTKEIYELNSQEIGELIKHAESYSKATAGEIRFIYNRIVTEKNMPEKVLPISKKKTKEIPAYELERYFHILAKLMDKLCDETFINSLLGNRTLSSLALYIYTHYISVWRRADIVLDLPKPNLKLIGFGSGQAFIEWLKSGNCFTEAMGKIICEDVQEKIYTHRKTANKNGGDLLLYVSEYMYGTYGLLLAICEANRQLTPSDGKADVDTLIAKGSMYHKRQREILPLIFEDAEDIFEGDVFSNLRANKAFQTYVAKKSEEWNIGVGYVLASIFRGHKINSKLIAEVTKVYITKDVNEASVRAFNMGVMSGVKYRLLEAIGVDISDEKKEIDKAVSDIKLNPFQIELTMKNLAEKSKTITKFLDKILTGKHAEITLKELLYGKSSYGKHVYTRCLYRAYVNAKEGQREYTINSTKPCIYANSEGCIGCSLVVAERFFLYEVAERLSSAVDALNSAENEVDKRIHFYRIANLYMPMIKEAYAELGMNEVESIVDVDKMMTVMNKHKYLAD
ncbi:hypothetical protein [Clostridium sp.]|uniref:hypothetical protein n=1 Tax=Clostridium sp. TaxID=1506 RepID=UPI00290AAD07|nr:hypothetical protein [Clostridium sp.]MDU3527037.1 hypothetical protein [Clostridium sp.]